MGGICGIVQGDGAPALDPALLRRMTAAIAHRGADGGEVWIDGGGVEVPGFRDLQSRQRHDVTAARIGSPVRSLTPQHPHTLTPHRPMVGLARRGGADVMRDGAGGLLANEEGTLWLVSEGEIANYANLRRDLERRGHRFRTRASVEAILHAFEEYGASCVHHLHGSFACAVWDARTQTLFLARDAIGQRPLYFAETGEHLLFASEIKSLLKDQGIRRALNPEALYHHLTFRFVPPPSTIFAGIQQLPPGHTLAWHDGRLEMREYWAGPAAWVGEADQLALEACSPAKLRETLCSAVAAQLGGDAPVGLFLSGGLDSSAIAAFMTGLLAEPARTFAIGFRGAGPDCELRQARAVAECLHTEHQELEVDASAVELLPQVLRHMDEPVAGAAAIPQYLLAQVARKHVDMVLSGVGADELFGGRPHHTAANMARRGGSWRSRWLGPVLRTLQARLPIAGPSGWQEGRRFARQLFTNPDLPEQNWDPAWDACFSGRMKSDLVANDAEDRFPSSLALVAAHRGRAGSRGAVDQALYADLKCYLPGEPLRLTERMAAAHALEARVPFLEHGVVEYAARIPPTLKISGMKTKCILRQAVDSMVPSSSLGRPPRGLSAPIDHWLRRELRGCVDIALGEDTVHERGLFRPEVVQRIVAEHRAGRQGLGQQVWMLFVFELWQRMYLDSDCSDRGHLTFSDLGLCGRGGAGRGSGSQLVAPAFQPAEERKAA
jgi:asparagine synthase (glutamine-hydrolysing)